MIDRRDFLKAASAGMGALLLPPFYGRAVAAEALTTKLDVSVKKKLADVALNTATKGGATYCDVRIGRYLRQFVITREDKVENVVNTESTGVGIRVIAGGTWGFAATSDLSEPRSRRRSAQAVAIAKANSKHQVDAGRAGADEGRRRGVLGDADQEELDGGADQGEGRPPHRRQQGGARGRRQLHPLDPLPRERAEVLRVHRRLLHRPGHPPHLGAGRGHGRRSGDGQVPHPRGPVGADGHGLRVSRAEEGRAHRAARRRDRVLVLLRHPRGRRRRGEAGEGQDHGALREAGQVRPRARPVAPVAHDPRVGRPSDGARPRARLRGELRRHELRHARQVAVEELQVRQRQGHDLRGQRRSRCALGGRRLRRRGRQVEALGHHQGRHPRQLPDDPRPGAHHRREGVAGLLLRRFAGPACSSSACRTCRSRRARRSSTSPR